MVDFVFPVAVGVFLLGLVLYLLGWLGRKLRGLTSGETVTLDSVTLFSKRYLLAGRPDRIVRARGRLIPEEWKSSKTLQAWHIIQLGTYFLLIEEAYGVKPQHGIIVLGDKSRHKIANTGKLWSQVLKVAEMIRAARKRVNQETSVSPQAWQCRVCGQRSRCQQARV